MKLVCSTKDDIEFFIEADGCFQASDSIKALGKKQHVDNISWDSFSYIGLIYSKYGNRVIDMFLKDISLCQSNLILSGTIPGKI